MRCVDNANSAYVLTNGGELIFERLDLGLEGKGLGVLRLALNLKPVGDVLKSVDDVTFPAELRKLVRGPLPKLLGTDLQAPR